MIESKQVSKPPAEKINKLFKKLHKQCMREHEQGGTYCTAGDRGMFMCNRVSGHKGLHIACTPEYVVHVWGFPEA